MEKQEVIEALNAIKVDDQGRFTLPASVAAHIQADELILAYVPEEIRAAYTRVVERCKWWSAA